MPTAIPTAKSARLPRPIREGQPLTALAPMQDVTSLPFMQVIGNCGAPDFFFTEYFRVHATSRLEPHILRSVTHNTTGRPVFAQLIGEDPFHLERTVRMLEHHAIAGIDLNLGCPAPKVYRKNVGGGLLRDPERIDAIFAALRQAIDGVFTVKMRLGFECTGHFETLLDLVNRHRIDLLSLHGRTVKQLYRSDVNYDLIRVAVNSVSCPVLANGNITSAEKAAAVLATTGAAGVMIGRSAIRNPWIFRQIREHFTRRASATVSGVNAIFQPSLSDLRDYIERLYHALKTNGTDEVRHVNRMKKFLNFVGQSVDPNGDFLYGMRRCRSERALFDICDQYLLRDGRGELPYPTEPFDGVIARPNCETPVASE